MGDSIVLVNAFLYPSGNATAVWPRKRWFLYAGRIDIGRITLVVGPTDEWADMYADWWAKATVSLVWFGEEEPSELLRKDAELGFTRDQLRGRT